MESTESGGTSKFPILMVGLIVAFGIYIYVYGIPDLSGFSMETLLIAGTLSVVGLIILYLGVTDLLALYLFILFASTLLFTLYYFDFISWDFDKNTLDVKIFQRPEPKPVENSDIAPSFATLPSGKEVFYVANNMFTYDQAEAVCGAYDSELASYSQIEAAYNSGGEWCGYGWTQGGIALFPTQLETWQKLQMESDDTRRKACGRPGINGGYFEPKMKFGVNCYGKKPGKPANVMSKNIDKVFNVMVNKYKDMIGKLSVAPFDKGRWNNGVEGGMAGGLRGGTSIVSGGRSGVSGGIVDSGSSFGGLCPPKVNVFMPLAGTDDLGLRGFQVEEKDT